MTLTNGEPGRSIQSNAQSNRGSRSWTHMLPPFLLLLLLARLTLAFKLIIINPTSNTVWRHKKHVWVHWKTEEGPPEKFHKIDIDLMVGPGEGEVIENISIGVPWSFYRAKWIVAKTLQPGCEYFVRITAPQDPSFRVKSERFGICGRKGINKQSSGSAPCASSTSYTAMAIAMALAQLIFW